MHLALVRDRLRPKRAERLARSFQNPSFGCNACSAFMNSGSTGIMLPVPSEVERVDEADEHGEEQQLPAPMPPSARRDNHVYAG